MKRNARGQSQALADNLSFSLFTILISTAMLVYLLFYSMPNEADYEMIYGVYRNFEDAKKQQVKLLFDNGVHSAYIIEERLR